MKIGLSVYMIGDVHEPVALAQAVERAGFESIWVPEHQALPTHPETPYPYAAPGTNGAIPPVFYSFADPFVQLAMFAVAAPSLRLATSICIMPTHHPLALAKTISTLDNFSNGRVILGMGSGWNDEELGYFGVRFEDRWKYTSESVEAMKRLWRDGDAAYDGQFVRFPEVRLGPRPKQAGGPPVLLGGNPTVYNFRRIARWADGWLAGGGSGPAKIVEARKAIDEECERIGRDPAGIRISIRTNDLSPENQRAYEDAGVERFVVTSYNHPGKSLPREEWGAAMVTDSPVPSQQAYLDTIEQLAEIAKL